MASAENELVLVTDDEKLAEKISERSKDVCLSQENFSRGFPDRNARLKGLSSSRAKLIIFLYIFKSILRETVLLNANFATIEVSQATNDDRYKC